MFLKRLMLSLNNNRPHLIQWIFYFELIKIEMNKNLVYFDECDFFDNFGDDFFDNFGDDFLDNFVVSDTDLFNNFCDSVNLLHAEYLST